ncbi:periphilin-1-like [Cheilinus undulatus]|uniref:periphilin-1-like n=1 Tax=Cheilinus undulatus TaxID=241271 RepID=UPI001BD34026|nr:periphilin-1-like [Cheilinus undulatus]
MAYRHGRPSIREAYEQRFSGMDSREVTVHRVVNIVDKRNPMPQPGYEYDRGYDDDQWYSEPHRYEEDREYHEDYGYPHSDRRYYDDNPNYGHFRRKSPPPRNDGPYSQQGYGRDDLRHQLASRKTGRARPYYGHKGRGSGPHQREDHREDYRRSPPVVMKRDRSPIRRETTQSSVRSGSNSSNRSFSPDRDKSYAQKHKPNATTSHTPSSTNTPNSTATPSSSVEESSHSSGSSKPKPELKEKTPAPAAETEEVVAASVEPKPTPDDDLKARRLEAIKAKALEIEKHYRQDCETFRTVVKMLVDKEPSLENLLQAPLDKNLFEIKERCLDSLKHFVKELDEVLEQPDT